MTISITVTGWHTHLTFSFRVVARKPLLAQTTSYLTCSVFQRGCPPPSSFFIFVTEIIIGIVVSSSEDSGICSNSKLSYLEHAVVFPVSDNLSTVPTTVLLFWMCFACQDCEILLRDWASSRPNIFSAKKELDWVDNFCNLNSYILPGHTLDELSSYTRKARLAFNIL